MLPNTDGCADASITAPKIWVWHIKHCWLSTAIYKIHNNIAENYNFQKQSESVNAFLIKVYKEERTVQNVVLEALLPFSKICLCEAGVSALHITNNHLWSWLQQQNFLWRGLSNTWQQFEMFQNSQTAYLHHNTPISVIILCLSSNTCTRKTIFIIKN
jgi:hypothetical protein